MLRHNVGFQPFTGNFDDLWVEERQTQKQPICENRTEEFTSFGTLEEWWQTLKPNEKLCVDCAGPNSSWLISKLGILLCLNCVGFHRGIKIVTIV